jgi:hypothetical protein
VNSIDFATLLFELELSANAGSNSPNRATYPVEGAVVAEHVAGEVAENDPQNGQHPISERITSAQEGLRQPHLFPRQRDAGNGAIQERRPRRHAGRHRLVSISLMLL